MRRTTTTAVLLTTVLALTGTACSSGDDGDDKPAAKKPAVTKTVTATPSLNPAETAHQCSLAIADAAPGWDDWNYSPATWQNDPRTPDICQQLADEENPPRGNRAFMDALRDGLELADDPRADQ